VEVWKGYKDFSEILYRIDEPIEAQAYNDKAIAIQNGIENNLWSNADSAYHSHYNGNDAGWNTFYPNAKANLWPIIFGLPEVQDRIETLYQGFTDNFKEDWKNIVVSPLPPEYPGKYWANAHVARAVVITEDFEALEAYDTNVQTKFISNREYPWNISDAGGYIKYKILLLEKGGYKY
jgi:hypothetical protein